MIDTAVTVGFVDDGRPKTFTAFEDCEGNNLNGSGLGKQLLISYVP